MKVLFVTQYGLSAASSRTRVFQYLPFLEAEGVGADVEVVAPDALVALTTSGGRAARVIYYLRSLYRAFRAGWRCLWMARRYDVLFIQKVLFPFPLCRLLWFCRRKVVFDFDDAVFTTEAPEEDWIARLRTWRHRRGLPPMLRAACHTIVENTYTAAYARQFCPEVSIITGPIDTERYCPGRREDRPEVVLGWIGSRSTAQYMEMIRAPLAELGRRHSHLRLCLIGIRGFEAEGLQTVWRDWSLETEVADLQTFDIGLMPLPDDPWTRGKGGYKILQYLAMGLPVVASPVGINREIVEDGINGFWATAHDEWVAHIERLIADPELRTRMGEAGRRKMEAGYSLHQSSRLLLQVLRLVVCGKG